MEFKVGDRVRIKSWEQMKKEFGMRTDWINCRYGFNRNMQHLCGRIATISAIDDYEVKLINWSDDSDTRDWAISTDMIELVNTSKFTKSDLQEGDVATDGDGNKSLYLNGDFIGDTVSFKWFTNDLKDKDGDSENDIVKIERPIKYETVFERKEEPKVREMTVEEISKALGFEVKVVK